MKTLLLVLSGAILAAPAGFGADRKLVMIAGPRSHPPLMHEFRAGTMLLHRRLQSIPGLQVAYYTNGWPKDLSAFDHADAIFIYSDGGGGHPAVQGDRLPFLASLVKKGVGFGCAHYAVEVPADKGGAEFKEWMGGHYEHQYSCNPIWSPEFSGFPEHPITRGVKPFTAKDEWYFNMRFRPEMKGVVPILVAKPSDKVRQGPYVWPAGPYDHIVAASGRDEAMMWAVERADGGRGFGFTGGHFHVNWADENFRKVVLNALLWLAKIDVPAGGMASSAVTDDELLENLDPKDGPKPTRQSLRASWDPLNPSPMACGCTPLPPEIGAQLVALTLGAPIAPFGGVGAGN